MSVRTPPRHTKRIKKPHLQRDENPCNWRNIYAKELKQDSEIGVYLKGIRNREGLTQKQLAKKLGISQHHISEIEHGKRTIGKKMAIKLGQVLKTNYRMFL